MKKITFLLTLLAMVVCNVRSAFADDAKWTDKGIATFGEAVTSLDNLNDGFYVLRNVGRKTFVKAEGEALKLKPVVKSTNFNDFKNFFQGNADVAYVFYLKKSATGGKYTIQGKTGNYVPNSTRKDESLSLNATEYEYTIEHIGGSSFGLKSDTYYLDGKAYDGNYMEGSVVSYNETLPGENSNGAYQLYPVTLDATCTVNFKYTVNNHVVFAASKKVVTNLAPSADNYPCLTITGYNKDVITEGGDVVVNCTMTLPFEVSSIESPKYYAIKLHTGNRMMVADEANSEVACYDVSTSLVELPEQNQWAFIGTDALESFKLYNKAAKKYLKSSGSGTIATLVDEAEASTFHVMATQVQNMTNGFCISNSSYYLNYQNPEGTNKPGVYGYGLPDQGSTCTIFTPASFPLNYANDWVNVPEGAIGGKAYLETAGNLTALKNAYNAVKNNANPTEEEISALVTINKAIDASEASKVTFKEGYYRLVNRKDHNFLHIVEGNNIMNTQEAKDKAVGSVVYFKSTGEEGKYNLMMEGMYLGTVAKSKNIVLGNEGSKGTYSVVFPTTDFVTKIQEISTDNEKNYHYLHVNGGNAVGWEAGEGAPASHWYVVPATDIEVDMNTVEGKSYATAYLPFAVSSVSGAEAYTGALNATKDQLDMTKVESVPANQGVVLVGTGNKATLTIGEATANIASNDLVGTNTKVTVNNANRANYLVFGKNKDNASEVGFFKPSATVSSIPANKAYLNASALAQGAIVMNFGGNVTGVNTVVLGENGVNAPVYDLSGRRVVAPVKGGVYIQNGKKFIK